MVHLAPVYAALAVFSNFVLISTFQLRKLQLFDKNYENKSVDF